MTVCTGLAVVVTTNFLGLFNLADGVSTLLPTRRLLFTGRYGITSQKTRMLVPERVCVHIIEGKSKPIERCVFGRL